ncbi:MAG: sigma-70 family RNA polymerase sigma factor [Planctomycetales bacterium]|nr:sigma-70 family RNA polymerase sigma factor [Planctomycetales bacterium]
MDRDAEFVDLQVTSQVPLRAFAVSLVGNTQDADDVLQSASIVLWQKRAAFLRGSDFFRWAAKVVHIEVLRHRRARSTEKLWFDESLLATLADEYPKYVSELDRHHEHLPRCLARLKPADRKLVELRYTAGKTILDIAEQLSRPQSTVYNGLARIRKALYECLRHSSSQEVHPS